MRRTELRIKHTWDGRTIDDDEQVVIELALSDHELSVEIDAPFHNDPAPDRPAGVCEGLWEFEVVEIFLRGEGDRYLELEFGPFGHFLALGFSAYRVRSGEQIAVDFGATRATRRWRGQASVLAESLPPGLRACNAYAIHGSGSARRFLAASPARGDAPDFHRLEHFLPLA